MTQISGTALLAIVKGVDRVPQDTVSSEVGFDSISLLDPLGFSCESYEVQFPNMKSSAVYADNPYTDGRTLVSGAMGNVSETLRVQVSAGTMIQLAAMLSKLGRFRIDCNDFWDTGNQIEPVFLIHQVEGEPGPRYALLYDLNMAIDTPEFPGAPSRLVTLRIEREPYWRSLAPGDNPKHWSYLKNKQSWVNGNTLLLIGNDHLTIETAQNRAELSSGSTGYLTKNYIDISADKIPGDAPALCQISITPPDSASTACTTVLMGKTSKPISGNKNRTSLAEQIAIYTFNAADGTVGTDTSLANDTGAPKPIGGGTAQRSVTTFATATMDNRISWVLPTTAVFRGKFRAFLRCRVSAAANVSLRLRFVQGSDTILTTAVTLTDLGVGGTGNTTDWALVDLGLITEPVNNKKAPVAVDGRGLWMDQDVQVFLQAARNSGAGSLYVGDLIFFPIEEGAIKIASTSVIGSSSTLAIGWVYDNTGYFTHGTPGDYATIGQYGYASPFVGSNKERDVPESAGGNIYLTPNVNNRLWFLIYVDSTKRSFITDPTSYVVRVNIVPRWQGLRSV